eukprot:2668265-Heterocapsa_arctica.AAC.1
MRPHRARSSARAGSLSAVRALAPRSAAPLRVRPVQLPERLVMATDSRAVFDERCNEFCLAEVLP